MNQIPEDINFQQLQVNNNENINDNSITIHLPPFNYSFSNKNLINQLNSKNNELNSDISVNIYNNDNYNNNCENKLTLNEILLKYTDPSFYLKIGKKQTIKENKFLLEDECYQIKNCKGMKHSWILEILFWIFTILTCGILLLLCKWYSWLKVYLTHYYLSKNDNSNNDNNDFNINNLNNNLINNEINEKNNNKKNCCIDAVLIETLHETQNTLDGSNGKWNICKVKRIKIFDIEIYYFIFRYLKFIYDYKIDGFRPVCNFNDILLNKEIEVEQIHQQVKDFLFSNVVDCNNGDYNDYSNSESGSRLSILKTFNNYFTYFYNKYCKKREKINEEQDTLNYNDNYNNNKIIKKFIFGKNSIETPVKSILQLLLDQLFHPFYIFQIFSVIIWISIDYTYYAIAIAIISTLSGLISLWTIRSNMKKLRNMTKMNVFVNQLFKNSIVKRIDSNELVPGDLIEIENGMKLSFDCILLSGSVIVNESCLTGESTPVKKTHIKENNCKLSLKKDTNHILFSGTNVVMVKPSFSTTNFNDNYLQNNLQNNLHNGSINNFYETHFPDKVVAMVTQAGFQTTRGKLILSIIYPKPNHLKLYKDSFKFMAVMFCFGVIGVIVTIISLLKWNVDIVRLIIENIILITIVVPPALPIALLVSISLAISRLQRYKIFCVAPQRMNVCGLIDLIVFDKTNTLTTDKLELHGIIPMEENNELSTHFVKLLSDENVADNQALLNISNDEKLQQLSATLNNNLFTQSIACCHNLSIILNKDGSERLIGDPLDIILFEATKWKLKEINNSYIVESSNDLRFCILKVFDFKSSLQRMSVVAKNLTSGELYYFVKGSSETIGTLCNKTPTNLNQILYKYSHKGYRVIAYAYRKVTDVNQIQTIENNLENLNRNQVECDLEFIGLTCLENPLKSDTSKVVKSLMKSKIKCTMCTGDNGFTAVCVGRKCNILQKGKKVYLSEWLDNNTKSLQNGITLQDNSLQNNALQNTQNNLEMWWDKIIWRNVDNDKDVILSNDILDNNYFIQNDFELAITGQIFNYILQHQKQLFHSSLSSQHNALDNSDDNNENNKITDNDEDNEFHVKNYVNITNPSLLHRVLMKCKIFARFSPIGKMQVIEEFQKMDYNTLMCGDGANDAIALKQAHVGVSLSSPIPKEEKEEQENLTNTSNATTRNQTNGSEASIAAPFTSLSNTLQCIPRILKEGRCALISSYQVFKFMSLYCLIQFFTVVVLFQKNSKLTDFQYLFVDLFMVLPVLLLMTKTPASSKLRKEKPPVTLLSKVGVLSWVYQIVLSFMFVLIVWIEIHVSKFDWFKPLDNPSRDVIKNYYSFEATCLFYISTYCTLNCAISFSISKPFKKSLFFYNIPFVISLILLYLFTIYITIIPPTILSELLILLKIPLYYKLKLVLYGFIHLLLSYGFEWIILTKRFRKILKKLSVSYLIEYLLLKIFKEDKYGKIYLFKLLTWLNLKRRKYKSLKQLFKNKI